MIFACSMLYGGKINIIVFGISDGFGIQHMADSVYNIHHITPIGMFRKSGLAIAPITGLG